MADFESQSWKERCDRYFSSLSDTGKDRDQEKQTKNDSENSRERRDDKDEFFNDEEKRWKDLSEIKKTFCEHVFLRNSRNVLSLLDIHGSNIASKLKNTVGFTIWTIITLASVITLSILLYFMLHDYFEKPSTFHITSKSTSERLVSSEMSLTVCNLNVIKKSRLPGTGLNELKRFVSGESKASTRTVKITVAEVIENNRKLKEFVMKYTTDKISELVNHIENNVIVKELTQPSDLSLLHRLSKYASPYILREVTYPSVADLEIAGHVTNETLVQCWKDNTKCESRNIYMMSESDNGNCVVVAGLRNSSTVHLVLNAQVDEYIHQITPSVGFKVSLGDSTELLSSSKIEISPGFRSTISIDKLTSTRRLKRNCDSQSTSKTECELNCLDDHILSICECSIHRRSNSAKLCTMSHVSDYVCVQALKRLKTQRHLPCHCREKCSEKKFDMRMSAVRWPHKQYTEIYGSSIFPGHQNYSESYLRENIAWLTVHVQPALTDEIEEDELFQIMDIMSRIGGLSALIAGASVITVVEILYLTLQSLVQFIRYIRKRSGSVASQRRLSDSEITSITWAMYRQRRRFEEVNKMKADKLANNVGVNAIGGNVHARILKRSSCDREPGNDNIATNSNKQYRPNEYARRYDGKNLFYQQRARDSLVKDSDFPKQIKGEDYKVNVIRPNRQNDYIYDNGPVHSGHALYKNCSKYKENNGGDRHHPQNVFLYDGAVAYFNPTSVSEPVYL